MMQPPVVLRFCLSLAFLLAVVSTLPFPFAALADDAVTLATAIRMTLERRPETGITVWDTAVAVTTLERSEAALDPQVTLRVGVYDDRTPVLSGFQPAETLFAGMDAAISQPLGNGGALTLTADYSRTRLRYDSVFAAQLSLLNPAWRGGVKIDYRHPLLRGAGRVEEETARAVAGTELQAARLRQRILARELALQTVDAFFRLLADEVRVRVVANALSRAERLLEDQRFRARFGLIEEADVIQGEALIAAQRLERQRAQANVRASRTALNRLLLRDAEAPLRLVVPVPGGDPPSLSRSLHEAEQKRDEFVLLRMERDIAEARLRLAREQARPQLDVIAEAGVFALERRPVDAAWLDPEDRYVGLSLEFTDTLGRRVANAELRSTLFTLRRAEARAAELREQLHDQLSAIHVGLVTGSESLRLAIGRMQAERRKYEAETARYRDGRSDTATLVRFESELAAAELDVEMQRLTLALADRQFAWARGVLLEELGIDPMIGIRGSDDLDAMADGARGP